MIGALTGEMLIAGARVRGTCGSRSAFSATSAKDIGPVYGFASPSEVDKAAALAEAAYDRMRMTSPQKRAELLLRVAELAEGLGSALTERAALETGLPIRHLVGELGAAAVQLRHFSTLALHAASYRATLDSAQQNLRPYALPDLRMQQMAIGPVAVLAANSLPFSRSVIGIDTAAAFAAGCPVIVLAHSGHLGSSELMGCLVNQAVVDCEFPPGAFSLLFGDARILGELLVAHPDIKAATFTGGSTLGLQLQRAALARSEPIPCHCQMGSVNPTFVLPGALRRRGPAIGRECINRAASAAGQSCLRPAVLVSTGGFGFEALRISMMEAVLALESRTMLSPAAADAYRAGLQRYRDLGAELIAEGEGHVGPWQGQATVLEVSASALVQHPELLEEVYGPVVLLVRCSGELELIGAAHLFRGQLAAAMHFDDVDLPAARLLTGVLERRVGRLIANEFSQPHPRSSASVHGGPFPASSDSRFSSTGLSAIERFLRPICYQGFPEHLLPTALRDRNEFGIPRVRDGQSEAKSSNGA